MAWINYHNNCYYKNATPAGEIEKKYTALGLCEVSYTLRHGDLLLLVTRTIIQESVLLPLHPLTSFLV